LPLEEGNFPKSIIEFSSSLPRDYLQSVAGTMSVQLERDDHANLKLLMHCFLALASPNSLEHTRRALYVIRRHGLLSTDVSSAVLKLERLSTETEATLICRRLYLLKVRRQHQRNIAQLRREGCADDASTASFDDMASEVLRSSVGQDLQMRQLLGDHAIIRDKIRRYCGQAKNWKRMAERFSSELILVLLPGSDLLGLTNSR